MNITAKEKHQISVITYNIHKGFGVGRMRFLLPEMRQALNTMSPDFIFLQEVQGEHKRRQKRIEAWPESPQTEFMAEYGWPYHLYAKNAVYQSGHHGNAILSQHAIDKFENINLSTYNRASRSILHAQVTVGLTEKIPLHLLCVHFGIFKAERKEQTKALMSRIIETVPEGEPLIMAGDFNDWRQELSLPLRTELGIEEAFYFMKGEHARSFPALRPSLSIDRIYFRGMKVASVKCLSGKPWRTLSDHLPLYAHFYMD